MNFFANIKNKFLTQNKTILLGRWNVIYCEKTINKKIDLSNEDHCGICNQYDYKNNSIINYNNYHNYDNKNYYNINKCIFFETL